MAATGIDITTAGINPAAGIYVVTTRLVRLALAFADFIFGFIFFISHNCHLQ